MRGARIALGLVVCLAAVSPARAANLLVNSGFATSLSGWFVEPGVAAWSGVDVAGSPSSGSARLENTHSSGGTAVTGITQCVVRFTPSRVEVLIEQVASGGRKLYTLQAVPPGVDELTGLQDRTGFSP
jgi:hypothetical protein